MTKLVTKKRIGVLMGGTSSERDVSMRSGLAIYQSLQELGYDSVLIDAGKDIAGVIKKEKIKLAFIALHGGSGEDGSIQGMLDLLGVPYTGSGVTASAIAMDKEISKKLFSWHGIPTAPFIVIKKPGKSKKHEATGPDIRDAYIYPDFPGPDFDLPWVVKPAAEGSSIGVSIVKEKNGLRSCLEETFVLGDRVLVEKFVKGKELHIAILGEKVLGGVEVRPSREFYNYEAKYTSGLTEYILPPGIDDDIYRKAGKLALTAHYCLRCSGATRVDFIIGEDKIPYILELNTLPGMTTTSLLPKIADSAGMSFNKLIEEIVNIAVKK